MAKQKGDAVAPDTGRAPLCRFSQDQLQSEEIVPVILEFQQPPVAIFQRQNPQGDAAAYRRELERCQEEFLDQLAAQCLNVQLGESRAVTFGPAGQQQVIMSHRFTHAFNGIGVWMPGRAVPEVASMAGVRTVTLNQERVYLTLDRSIPFVGAPRIWERLGPENLPLKGEGVIVAVIDTGLDWTHPALGGFAEAPNDKVVHVVSFTGEDPMDNFGHGTHVAGIIAGDKSYKGTARGDSQVDGVAPRAKLMGYKVLTAAGSGSASNIVLAIEDAVKRGVHVINLSLGDGEGDPYSPESSAANNAMLAGVVVAAAAGNAGPTASTIGAPGSAHHVITVGASTDDGVTALRGRWRVGEEERHFEMRLLEGSIPLPSPPIQARYLPCGRGIAAEDFPAAVKGHVALVERGEVTFREKALGAQKAGAIACLIYNNQPGGFFGTLGDEQEQPTIPVVTIAQQDGHAMREAVDHGSGISTGTLQLHPEGIPQPDEIAEFSSRGPNNDGWIKPEITAPGVNVFAPTIPQAPSPGGGMPDPSGYISASGTSMATPHIAGAAALIRQAHPDWTPLMIKAALVNTARFMAGQGTVMDQGAGALRLEAAIDCTAILVTQGEPFGTTHAFGRVAHGGKEKKVSQGVQLMALPGSPKEQEWELSVELGATLSGVKAALSKRKARLDPGKPVTLNLSITANGAEGSEGLCYGWAVATSGNATLRLPFYAEIARTLEDTPIQPGQSGQHRFPAQPIRRKRVGDLCCC